MQRYFGVEQIGPSSCHHKRIYCLCLTDRSLTLAIIAKTVNREQTDHFHLPSWLAEVINLLPIKSSTVYKISHKYLAEKYLTAFMLYRATRNSETVKPVSVYVEVLSLAPWPNDSVAVSIGWQEGQDIKNGSLTKPVSPVNIQGKTNTAVVPIGQSFELEVKLFGVRSLVSRSWLEAVLVLTHILCAAWFVRVSLYLM